MSDQNATTPVRLAVDIGGTFVDAIRFTPATGEVALHKASTTPSAPTEGVMAAVAGLHEDLSVVETFIHGTTLGLNAILQRRGAPVGIITNEGFRDLLEIARAALPDASLYDFTYQDPPPLVARRHRYGVAGRMNVEGHEVEPLDERAVLEAARALVEVHGLGSIAVCFLHSYRNPAHEQRAAELIRAAFPDVQVSVSTDLSREYREYERTSTVALDGYIRPLLNDYVGRLEERFTDEGFRGSFHVMRSGGGAMTADQARRAPLLTVLSGPAGGIAGTAELSERTGWDKLISFDVGGTSVDACVIVDGRPGEVHQASIDGLPMQIPVFDIRTIGAGGGSIAWVDDGLLRVGPRSAGAVPGPVAYGTGGTQVTVTDAAVVLGHLDPDAFLGGAMKLDAGAAEAAVRQTLAEPLGMGVTRAAHSVYKVLLSRTVGALREITVEKGLDPRDFRLVAFGGAGPLLAPLVGRELGIAQTVVPRFPAAFSALGMLMTDLEYDTSATVLLPLIDKNLTEIEPLIRSLVEQARDTLAEQAVAAADRVVQVRLDLRYRGQEHTLTILRAADEDAAELAEAYGVLHEARHGHRMDDPCEIVTIRVRGIGRTPKPLIRTVGPQQGDPAPVSTRPAFDVATEQLVSFGVYDRDSLGEGAVVHGPAIIAEPTSTTVMFSDQTLRVDAWGQLLISANDEENR